MNTKPTWLSFFIGGLVGPVIYNTVFGGRVEIGIMFIVIWLTLGMTYLINIPTLTTRPR